jgi:hypothetical protein
MTSQHSQGVQPPQDNPAFVQMPVAEYQRLLEELALLKNTELLQKFHRLIDLLYQDKYGLYMGNDTDDLSEYSTNTAWNHEP